MGIVYLLSQTYFPKIYVYILNYYILLLLLLYIKWKATHAYLCVCVVFLVYKDPLPAPYLRSCTTLRLGAADLSRQASRKDLVDKSPASVGESEFTHFILEIFWFPTMFLFVFTSFSL